MELPYKLLPHPSYSPDLASGVFFFFQNEDMDWQTKYLSNEEVIAETEANFSGFDKNYFLDGFRKLEHL